MSEDAYEKRMKMTEWEKSKESMKKGFKNLFKSTAKEADASPKQKKTETPNQDLGSNIKKRRAAEKDAMKEYKKGGKVAKTGPAKLHKGERVLTTKQTKKLDKKPVIAIAIGLKKKPKPKPKSKR